MRRIVCIFLSIGTFATGNCQNALSGPLGLYGQQYNAATTILNGGNVLVAAGGNWYLGGNITSADKGNPNSPGATGRSEAIIFTGTGTYANASSSSFVDGYAGVISPAGSFTLPIGTTNASGFYAPVTVPANSNAFSAAYFSGSGSTTNTFIGGTSVTIFSPYIDAVTTAVTNGTFTLTYPPGFVAGAYNYIVGSTNSGTSWTELSTAPVFSPAGGSVSTNITVPSANSLIAFATSETVLAEELISFTAVPVNNSAVLLNWHTASESNSLGFTIQRSVDGGVSWVNLGFVSSEAPDGNSNTPLDYTYTDPSPVNGVNYYRLGQQDKDGHVHLSNTNAVIINDTRIEVYPNPVTSRLYILGAHEGAFFRVLSVSGNTVIPLTNSTTIDVSGLAQGVYFLQMQSNGINEIMTFEKK